MAAAPYIVTEGRYDRFRNPNASAAAIEKKISRQIDDLVHLSLAERDKQLGQNFIQDMKNFYNLTYSPTAVSPSYRPNVMLPELQFLILNETSDLTNELPKVYITQKDQFEEQREKVFQANWKQGKYNQALLMAALWSQFVNVAWVQVGFDPLARNGRGMVWLQARDPDSVHPDPAGDDQYHWQFLVLEDWLYIDEIKRRWPEQGKRIRPQIGMADTYAEWGSSWGTSFEMPPGPMRQQGEIGTQPLHHRDTRLRVRHLYIFDNAKERIEEVAGSALANDLVVIPKEKWRYPNGRYIAECEGIVLADGPNYVPRLPEDDRGTFPLVGIWSLPALCGMWGPPPIRYGRGTQELAERMYTQVFENCTRINNAVTFIPQDTGIDIDAYGGMPGEVQIILPGSQPPTMMWPKEMPNHMVSVPETLLQKVRQYQGFTPVRQGQTPQGNLGTEAYDASLFQSQALTRLRARLYAVSVERIAQLVFYMMATYKTQEDWFALPGKKEMVEWSPIADPNQYQCYLDEASLQVMSKTALQKVALALAGKGIPTQFLLESYDIPRAKEIAEEGVREMELAALSKLRRPR